MRLQYLQRYLYIRQYILTLEIVSRYRHSIFLLIENYLNIHNINQTISTLWIRKRVSASSQSGRYNILYLRGLYSPVFAP